MAKGKKTKPGKNGADSVCEIDGHVGRAVWRRRKQIGQTLAELSEASGISAAMISRIENGQSSASLSSLQQIAKALGVPVISLFEYTLQSTDINYVRAEEGLNTVRVTAEGSHWYSILGKHDNASLDFTASSVTLDKQDQIRFPVYQGEGFIFILAKTGRARYRCGDQVFELAPGDTLSFDARLKNGFESLQSDRFSFITVFAKNR